MEPFYYNKMNKLQQAVYHGMLQGINALESEIQIPRIDGRELYDIFFQMRLDHPEVFWRRDISTAIMTILQSDPASGIFV